MAYNFSDIKVLVVETSPPLFDLMRSILNLFTVPQDNVMSAYSVEEGFMKFKANEPDIVIIDWMERPNDGLTLVRKIRTQKDGPNPFVPILMTSGSGHFSKVIQARDCGISEFLIKPFSAKTLAAKVERIVENARPFILCETFIGPDRRTREMPFMGDEKRVSEPEVVRKK